MSPDETRFQAFLATATRRQRALLIAEAVAWATAAAAGAALVATALGLTLAGRTAMVAVVEGVVAAGIGLLRRRRLDRRAVTRAIERVHADARNVIITADELSSGALAATARVRARVFAEAAALSQQMETASAFPLRPLVRAVAIAVAAWVVVAAVHWSRSSLGRVAPGMSRSATTTSTNVVQAPHVTVTNQPPAYTGLAAATLVDPPQIDAIQGSVLTLLVESRAARITAEHDNIAITLSRDQNGRCAGRVDVAKSGYLAIDAGTDGRRVIPLVVTPDALPAVRVTTPGRDLVFADAAQRIDFAVRATDDFGVRALSLQYTRVTGSGEQFEFQEGEIPLTITRTSSRDWNGRGARSLADLNLKDGDMLVYRAVAADARPGDGSTSSDAFFIEISRLGMGAGDAFTLPEQESRYALSEQMLIIKTERLNSKRSSMASAEFADAALNLAVEQRMIRTEFVFMLGGEVEDEEVEAQESTELQEGRQQNRGQRDLRAATVAMSRAQKLLTGADTASALTAERAAVIALQRAFARDRYILRALATRTELDPGRRLTGSLSEAVNWRRDPPATTGTRRAVLLQDLLAGIGALRSSSPSSDARQPQADALQATALAREALRIDVDSKTLRTAAADLQHLADAWAATSRADRNGAVDAIASVVAGEAARTLATPPLTPRPVIPPLAGAFGDALRRHGGSQ